MDRHMVRRTEANRQRQQLHHARSAAERKDHRSRSKGSPGIYRLPHRQSQNPLNPIMRSVRLRLLLLLLALCALGVAEAQAQLSVQLKINRRAHLIYEPVLATVSIT